MPLETSFLILGWGLLGSLLFIAFTSGRSKKNKDKPESAADPTEDELKNPGAVAAILHKLNKNYQAYSDEWKSQSRTSHRWSVGTAIGVWAYTIITIGIFCTSIFQTDIARQSLTTVQRAFINVSELRQEPISDKGNIIGWRFTPNIVNSGNTPASVTTLIAVHPINEGVGLPFNIDRNQYAYISWKVGAPRDPDEMILSYAYDLYALTNFTIGPKGTVTAFQISQELPITVGLDAQSNKIGRFFYGSIHY